MYKTIQLYLLGVIDAPVQILLEEKLNPLVVTFEYMDTIC